MVHNWLKSIIAKVCLCVYEQHYLCCLGNRLHTILYMDIELLIAMKATLLLYSDSNHLAEHLLSLPSRGWKLVISDTQGSN